MFEELPKRIRAMAFLTISTKSMMGRAHHLQRFLYALLTEPRYGYGIFCAYQKSLEDQKSNTEIKKRAYTWFENEIERLSKSRAARFSFVAAPIRHFRQLFKGKRPTFIIDKSFMWTVLDAYKKVVFAIEPFGEMELLREIGDFVEQKKCLVFTESECPLHVNKRVQLSPWNKDGKVLANKLQRGFKAAILERVKLVDGPVVIKCSIEFVGSIKLNWTDCVDLALDKEDPKFFQESLETDIGKALGYINFLIQVCNHRLTRRGKKFSWPKIADPLILDKAVNDWHVLRYCISLGSGTDPLDLFSPQAIEMIIKLFSAMVSNSTYHLDEVGYPKWKSWLSNEVANYAENTLSTWLEGIKEEDRRLIRKQDAYSLLIQHMKKAELPQEFINLTTETLVYETVCPKINKKIKWNPMRGGPKRENLLKKLGSIPNI